MQVSYVQAGDVLIARDVEPLAAQTLDVTGTITQIAPDQGSFTLRTDSGDSLTFQTDPDILTGLPVDARVDVTYSQVISGLLTAQDVEYQ